MSLEYVSYGIAPEETRTEFAQLQVVFENDVGALAASLSEMEGYVYANETGQPGGISRRELEAWGKKVDLQTSKLKSTFSSLKAAGPVSFASNVYDAASAVNAVVMGGSIVDAALGLAKIPATSALTTVAIGFASPIIAPVFGVGIVGLIAVGIVAGIANYAASEAWDSAVKYLKFTSPTDDLKVSVDKVSNKAYFVGSDDSDKIYLPTSGENSIILGRGGNDQINLGQSANGLIIEGGQGEDSILIQGAATIKIRPGDGIDNLWDFTESRLSSNIKIEFEGDFGILGSQLALVRSLDGRTILTVSTPAPGILPSVGVALNSASAELSRIVSFNGVEVDIRDLTHYVFGALEGGNETLYAWSGNALIDGLDGADDMYGGDNAWGTQTFKGGRGNDSINYYNGSNTVLIFERGDGADRVSSRRDESASGLSVTFNGVRIDEIDVQGWGDTLVIKYGDNDSVIFYDWADLLQISELKLANGTLSGLDIITRATTGSELGDSKIGTKYSDYIQGFGGFDVLTGNGGDDTLVGGLGYDTLTGGEGLDHYLFSAGWGIDTVNGGEGDQIHFDESVSFLDLEFYRNPTAIYVSDRSGNLICIENIYRYGYEMDLVFSDGYRVSTSRIKEMLKDDEHIVANEGAVEPLSGGQGKDTIIGSSGDDFIDGGEGVDYLAGKNGDDAYVIDSRLDIIYELEGEGNDTVISFVDIDIVTSPYLNIENIILAGSANTAHGSNVGNLIFGNSGNNQLFGLDGNDTIQGGEGNDYIGLGEGDNFYIYNVGDGVDTISDYHSQTGFNTLLINVEFDNVTISRGEDGLSIRINEDGGEIRLNDFASISQFQFANGLSMSRAELQQRLEQVSGLNDDVYGTYEDDYIDAGQGADTVSGLDGNDVLVGGEGNDNLYGGSGSDVYYFEQNSGSDNISDVSYADADIDTISFGEGIASTDLSIYRDGDDLKLKSTSKGIDITVTGQFNNGGYLVNIGDPTPVELLRFSDGSLLSLADQFTSEVYGTLSTDSLYGDWNSEKLLSLDGDDYIWAGGGNDTLNGGLGNDVLDGGLGSDTFEFEKGFGVDTIIGIEPLNGKSDKVKFGSTIAPENLILVRSTDRFNDLIVQFSNSADSLIIENYFRGENNSGYGGGYGPAMSVIDLFVFANGDIWDAGEVRSRVKYVGSDYGDEIIASNHDNLIEGRAGNDLVYGMGGNDSIYGGRGNDTLYGGDGNDLIDGGAGSDFMLGGMGDDTYRVDSVSDQPLEEIGGGIDSIQTNINYELPDNVEKLYLSGKVSINGHGNSQNNYLRGNTASNFLSGMNGNDTLAGLGGQDTLLGGGGDDIYVIESEEALIIENSDEGVDLIRSYISLAMPENVENLTLYGDAGTHATGNSGNNIVRGDASGNVISGSLGNDSLFGGAGDDTYLFTRGDGKDVISEAGLGNDKLVMLDVNYEQLWLTMAGNNLNISVIGTQDIVKISNWRSGGKIESIVDSSGHIALAGQIDSLVSAMSAFSPPPPGQSELPESYRQTLESTFAANWN